MSTYFFCKLIPPRPTFPGDMTEAEGTIMREHFVYWRGLLEKRKAVVYGPVVDPQGTYGVSVLEVEDEAEARGIAENDPTIVSGAGFQLEVYPMPKAIVRP